MRAKSLLLMLATGVAVAAAAQSGQQPSEPPRDARLLPKDESGQAVGLRNFLDSLRSAVKDRDVTFILSASEWPVRQRFEFGLARPASASGGQEAADWAGLEGVLALGGAFTTTRGAVAGRKEYCAPYVYSAYPTTPELIGMIERMPGHNENPEGEPWAVVGARVPVFKDPTPSSAVITHLSYDLVIVDESRTVGTPSQLWHRVFTPRDGLGWLSGAQLRRPRDFRVCFAELNGTWRIVSVGTE